MTSLVQRSIFAALACLGSAGSQGAEPETRDVVVSGEVFQLPEFVVSERPELPPAESWLYAETPGFEILSAVTESRTKRFARDFQRLQQVIAAVWPSLSTGGGTSVPVMIVLCDDGREFEALSPRGLSGDDADQSSFFLEDGERQAIVVEFSGTLNLRFEDRAIAAEAEQESGGAGGPARNFVAGADPYRAFYQQYFRYLVRRSAGRTRPWLEEGLVQVMASIDFSRKHAAIGKLDADTAVIQRRSGGVGGANYGPSSSADSSEPLVPPGSESTVTADGPVIAKRGFALELAAGALIDLGDLFAPEPPRGVPSFRAQSFAFVHLCLFGYGKRYQRPFFEFIRRTAEQPATEDVFRECFGMSYQKMEMVLRDYVDFTVYEHVEFRAKDGGDAFPELPPVVLRGATQAEVGRIKGETFRLAGQPEPARQELIAAYLRGEKDPRLLAALGLYERSIGRDARARKFLEAAAAGQVERPRAYLELARMRFAEEKSRVVDGGRLSRLQVYTVLAPLHTGCAQLPPMVELYETIAEVWLATDETPTKDDLRRLYGGAYRFSTHLKLVYLAASVAVRAGDAVNGRALIEHGVKHAPSEQTKLRFHELEQLLPPPGEGPAQEKKPTGAVTSDARGALRNDAPAASVAGSCGRARFLAVLLSGGAPAVSVPPPSPMSEAVFFSAPATP